MASRRDSKAGSDGTKSFDERSHLSNAHSSRESSSNLNPASILLQDLLREKRYEARCLSRPDTSSDIRKIQSSPAGSKANRLGHARRASGLPMKSTSVPKEMGVRQMEDYIDKINKQNFDLKLELFYRRQRQESLEQRLDKMDMLEVDIAEAHKINEELLQELEKRDQTIKEAVEMIYGLEEKAERLEMARTLTTPSASVSDPTTPSASADVIQRLIFAPSSPPTSLPKRATPVSPFSADGDGEIHHTPKSPALSFLSFSSLVSMYGGNQAHGPPSPRAEATPSPMGGRSENVLSNRDVLHPPQHLNPPADVDEKDTGRELMDMGTKTKPWAKGKMIGRKASQRIRQGIKQNIPGFLKPGDSKTRGGEFG